MNDCDMKCAMILDSELPIGVIANTSAILGVTLGKHIPEQVGDDVVDATDKTHLGIITIPIVMLKGNKDILKDLRERLYNLEFSDMIICCCWGKKEGKNCYFYHQKFQNA